MDKQNNNRNYKDTCVCPTTHDISILMSTAPNNCNVGVSETTYRPRVKQSSDDINIMVWSISQQHCRTSRSALSHRLKRRSDVSMCVIKQKNKPVQGLQSHDAGETWLMQSHCKLVFFVRSWLFCFSPFICCPSFCVLAYSFYTVCFVPCTDWLIEHGLTSAPTQYRLYGRRFLQPRLRYFGHVVRMDQHRLPNIALYGRVEGKRVKGRSRKRWLDNVTDDCYCLLYTSPSPRD